MLVGFSARSEIIEKRINTGYKQQIQNQRALAKRAL
jgi:hypothetical protein